MIEYPVADRDVALARTLEAFEEDCRRAALVVSVRVAPPDCAALVIDRKVWQRNGAVALRRVGKASDIKGWEITAARPDGTDRPWARSGRQPVASAGAPPPTRAQPNEATPRTDDLEPGD